MSICTFYIRQEVWCFSHLDGGHLIQAWERQRKVGDLGYGSLQNMSMDKRATSKSTQFSTKVWVKRLLLENTLKLNF